MTPANFGNSIGLVLDKWEPGTLSSVLFARLLFRRLERGAGKNARRAPEAGRCMVDGRRRRLGMGSDQQLLQVVSRLRTHLASCGADSIPKKAAAWSQARQGREAIAKRRGPR